MPKFEKGADAMAATRLIPLHVNKGKTIAQSLGVQLRVRAYIDS